MSKVNYITSSHERFIREYDWHSKVYKTTHQDSGLASSEWRLLRDSILRRDRFTCQRCNIKFRTKKQLSVHHIIPRDENGSNNPGNLITLCLPCHDFIEVGNYRSRAAIIGSLESETSETPKKDMDAVDEDDPYQRPEWHKYVYGGARRGDH